MNFIKNGKEITITKSKRFWKLAYSLGKLQVEVKVLICEYPTEESVKELILTNELFGR